MKILHLYSDWKWTGPAEPVLQMCRALMDRGHEVMLAHTPDAFKDKESVSMKAEEYGLEATSRFALDRHFPPLRSLRDALTLPRFVSKGQYDVVHMHLSHDHAFGGFVIKAFVHPRPILIRTFHKRTVLKNAFSERLLVKRLTDGYLTFTDGFRRQYISRFGLDPDCVGVQPMTIDLERFSSDREFRDVRSEFGIPSEAPVIGIVGRFQKYRKMDIFLRAAKKVLEVAPETRFVVIGRSGQMQETVVKPMKELGLTDRVILTGYRIDDYADILASLDIFSLLMPGFDGTARAVREAMALGKPCVVSDFGMLPDIVPHEVAGLNTPLEVSALANAWLRLVQNPDQLQTLGDGARKHALTHFRMDSVGPALEDFYQHMLRRHRQQAE